MNFNINDFTGPLDLLLHMVKRHEMDIYEIDIKIIIDEYIEFINTLPKNDLEKRSEYLVMASELVHLKSKLLLGLDEEENDDGYEITSEDDLRNRLLEYEKYQNVSNDFRLLEANRLDYFTKVPESLREYSDGEKLDNSDVTIEDLVKALLDAQARFEYKKPKNTKIARKEISVKERITYIKDRLKEYKKMEFTELFKEPTKEELVVTLLSILEMTKNHEVCLSQEENFSKIYVEALYE